MRAHTASSEFRHGFLRVALLLTPAPVRGVVAMVRPGHTVERRYPPSVPRLPSTDEARGSLRGAAVEVEPRRVVRIAGWCSVVVLLALTGVLAAAGAHKNAQIEELRDHGVGVRVTVLSCRGLLGGSGTNAAGYTCAGVYVLDGARHTATLPGNIQLAPGTVVAEIAATTDPGLLSSAQLVRSERSSPRVYLVPAVLLAGAVALGAALLRRRRADRQVSP